MNNEKILIISHNPLSTTQNNGKTLYSFFSNRQPDSVCQLFFTMDTPDFSYFNNFFQITDLQLLKRFFGRKTICGGQVEKSQNAQIIQAKKNLNGNAVYRVTRYFALKRIPLIGLFRDFLWREKRWKTDNLKEWIEKEKPDVVFFQSSGSIFSFNVVKWVCKTWGLPLIMETTDDYVSAKFSLDPFFWIRLSQLKRVYKWAATYANAVITIGDAMKDEYEKRFGGNYFVAMNSVSPNECNVITDANNKGIITLVYAGNLGIGRWQILKNISKALEELDKEGIRGQLKIYSLNSPSKKIEKYINNPPYSKYMGSLTGDDLNEVINNATCVVHVESFLPKHKYVTRLSISTKISEYMNSQSCIFAVGPSNVASIKYLMDYDIAETVTNIDINSIKTGIKNILHSNRRSEISKRASTLYFKRHNIERTQIMISDIIKDAVNNSNI